MDKEKTVAIIGAGPAGLTAADELCRKGYLVHVYEAQSSVGGMAKSISIWNQIVDLGPHRFFSSDTRVNKKWLEVIKHDYAMVNRLTRIYYNGKFFAYPLKPFDALKRLGIFESLRCVLSYVLAKINPSVGQNTFEEWVRNRFGHRLFSIFFKSYSEKLWGISCKELDADFAAQRIKKLSLAEAVKSAFLSTGKKHKTLVDEFAYPNSGAGAVYEKMAESILERGGKIFLNASVREVVSANNKVEALILDDGKKRRYHHIISTMPITNLIQTVGAPKKVFEAAKSLTFRNTILVYLKIAGPNPFPDQWLYIHSDEVLTGRITNFQNWVDTINNGEEDAILCLEYWCYDDDKIWSETEDALITLAREEVEKIGLVDASLVQDGTVVRVPKCYPVYKTGYRGALQIVEDALDSFSNLSVIGRYGAFKYNNQDHSILMGLMAAENIVSGEKKHDLWGINTDYEYQESSYITATGLSSND